MWYSKYIGSVQFKIFQPKWRKFDLLRTRVCSPVYGLTPAFAASTLGVTTPWLAIHFTRWY